VYPFAGQRWYDVWPERIAWHVFTVGVLGLLLLVLLISIDSLGERTAKADTVRAAIPVQVESVEPRSRHSSIRLPGVAQPGARVELGFRVDGHSAGFRAEEGQRVEVGEVIADLDRSDLERELAISEAVLVSARARHAESRLGRQTVLLARSSTPQERHGQAELDHQLTRARVSEGLLRLGAARARLEKASLIAPFSGHIERILVDAHEQRWCIHRWSSSQT
jgi:multidrug efflux pump subunit AcrA (membrane-fusion protein)